MKDELGILDVEEVQSLHIKKFIQHRQLDTDIFVYLYLTENGWRISEINAGDLYGYRALSFGQYVILKQLLYQRFIEIDDNGLSNAKENEEVYYERYRPNPHPHLLQAKYSLLF